MRLIEQAPLPDRLPRRLAMPARDSAVLLDFVLRGELDDLCFCLVPEYGNTPHPDVLLCLSHATQAVYESNSLVSRVSSRLKTMDNSRQTS